MKAEENIYVIIKINNKSAITHKESNGKMLNYEPNNNWVGSTKYCMQIIYNWQSSRQNNFPVGAQIFFIIKPC